MDTHIYLTRAQARDIDQQAIVQYGMPSILLMENAGRGAAEKLITLGIKGNILICCGKGNNGGDGFVMARHLDNKGVSVQVMLFADPQALSEDAAVNYQIILRSGLKILPYNVSLLQQKLANLEWLVDGLFGTGLQGEIRPPFDRIIGMINRSKVRIFALDIPSGLDCDTGRALGAAIKAEHTVTFIASKKGFTEPMAKQYLGQVHEIDIGIPHRLLQNFRIVD